MENNLIDDDISLDMTPLIDVIFMLLIFFIMTTTFNKPAVEILLPMAEMTEELEAGEEIVIAITDEGGIFFHEQQISGQDLDAIFAEQPDATVNLHVDRYAPFEAFVEVVDKAKARDGGKLVISAETQ